MNAEQFTILAILAATVGSFIWGRWRHDMVALASLFACVFVGLLEPADAFMGFAHPAVVTVASVLILSRGLQSTGAMDMLAQRLMPKTDSPTLAIGVLAAVGAVMSGFMNNVGAMALLMPVAADVAGKCQLPPGKVLMPLSFGTILGGMTTLIGTPPNLIVSGFRASVGAGSYGMFDFTPVGLTVALVGVTFVALLGWRLVPMRPQAGAATFDTGTYLTEAVVEEKSSAAGKSLAEIEEILREADAQVVGLVRNERRLSVASPGRAVYEGDILVIEAEPESLSSVISTLGLKLEGEKSQEEEEESKKKEESSPSRLRPDKQSKSDDKEESKPSADSEAQLRELVVMPDSPLVGRSVEAMRIRTHYEISLLALSRQGRRSVRRLRSTPMHAGDALLMLGTDARLNNFASEQGCVPLAQRSINIPHKHKAAVALLAMALAVTGAAFGLLPAAISFSACVLAFMALKVLPLREVYGAIDGSVVVLLAALIPVAGVMESTGAAELLAKGMLEHIVRGHAVVALALLLVITMTLSDFMNNAATAAVMCPIALGAAAQLEANPDSFLMAVAIGASCAFLTPIGHQNNTLILGPGGFRFGDYWRMGLPMEILVMLVGIPMLLWVWPL
ncbi:MULTISPECIES: SLC13 family permease [unclassified Microbulbifer]|uniref:SLC13 family permease n=1 Tax=unclassified Microbulbifer TaxID=2619833 RepID=UPI0027E4797D|nr:MULTISPECIES: SLC13 family permease [unclassified Microbulbifer]